MPQGSCSASSVASLGRVEVPPVQGDLASHPLCLTAPAHPSREAGRATPTGVARAGRPGAPWEVSPTALTRRALVVAAARGRRLRRMPGWRPRWRSRRPGGLSRVPAGAAYRPVDLLGVVLAVAAPLALLWRSTAPLAVMAATGLFIAVNAAAGYGVGFLSWPAWIALFTCYAVGGRRLRVAATSVAIAAVGAYLAFDHGMPASHLPGIAVSFVFACVAGELSRRRTRAAAAEARRADEAAAGRWPRSGCSRRNAPDWLASCTTRWGTRST